MIHSSGTTEPCGCNLDHAYAALKASDEIVFKALGISEIAQIARAEQRLRDFLHAKWNRRAKEAAKRAGTLAQADKKPAEIVKAIDAIMAKWAGDVIRTFQNEIDRAYKQARIAGHKKATQRIKLPLTFDTPNLTSEITGKSPPGSHEAPVNDPDRKKEPTQRILKATKTPKGMLVPKAELLPSFDLADEAAMTRLGEHQALWISDHYDKNVSVAIRNTTKETMGKGLGRVAAGKALRKAVKDQLGIIKTPGGFSGTAAQYFEGLAANAMTTARVHGQLRSFSTIGITKYVIRNPSDRRTCPVCNHMVGKVFTTQQGVDQAQREMDAETPSDIKAAHPWRPPGQLKTLSPTPGKIVGKAGEADAKTLAGAGMALPPFHFRCRCTVDVSVDTASFSDLAPIPPPVPGATKTAIAAAGPKGFAALQAARVGVASLKASINKMDSLIGPSQQMQQRVKAREVLAEALKDSTDFNQFIMTREGLSIQKFKALSSKAIDDLRFKHVTAVSQAWSITSAGSVTSLGLQIAAQQEFGLISAATKHFNQNLLDKIDVKTIPGLRAFVREQYKITQTWLKKNGIKNVILYRGEKFNRSQLFKGLKAQDKSKLTRQTAKLKLQPLSSYSSDPSISVDFADTHSPNVGVVSASRVPAERIIGAPPTGMGVSEELEMVVLGGVDEASVVVIKGGQFLNGKNVIETIAAGVK